jgi:TRAP-type C4-dicarboxylate transport system permease large subunit
MLLPGVIGLSVILTPDAAIQTMSYNLISWFSNYALTVGPMFGLMGFFASYSGLGSKLFNTLESFVGHRRGGLAQATVVACAGFGAINGNVMATIATMSSVAYPEMRKKGYSPVLAGPVVAAAPMISVPSAPISGIKNPPSALSMPSTSRSAVPI